MMLVHVMMPKVEEPEPAAADAAAAATAAPAEPEVIKKGKVEKPRKKRNSPRPCSPMKLIAGLGNPGRSTGARATTSASRSSTSWRGATAADVRVVAGRGGRRPDGATPDASDREAAHVHEPERAGGRRAGAVLQDRARPTCSIVVRRGEAAARAVRVRARGSAGGHNGLQVDRSAPGTDRVSAPAPRRRPRRARSATWPITCFPGSSRTSAA